MSKQPRETKNCFWKKRFKEAIILTKYLSFNLSLNLSGLVSQFKAQYNVINVQVTVY